MGRTSIRSKCRLPCRRDMSSSQIDLEVSKVYASRDEVSKVAKRDQILKPIIFGSNITAIADSYAA
jgi:hypothetical protein